MSFHPKALRRGRLSVLLLAPVVLATVAVGSSAAQLVGADGKNRPLLVFDSEFAADPSLVATPQQTIIFRGDAAESTGRYHFQTGLHYLCLSGGAQYFGGIRVDGSHGRSKHRHLNHSGCVHMPLADGVYTLRLIPRNGQQPPPSWSTAALEADPAISAIPPVPLVDSSNSPAGGFWAIQDTTFNAHGTFGNRILSTTPGPNAMLFVDPSTAYDALSLFQLPPSSGQQLPALLGSAPALWSIFFYAPYIVPQCAGYCGYAYGPPPGLQIKDDGNYVFQFNIEAGAASLYGETNNGITQLNPTLQGPSQGDAFQVVFRFYPDGTQLGQLSPGEIALYQGNNLSGKAAVFIPLNGAGAVSPPYPLSVLSSSTTTLDATARSAQVGPGAGFYWGPNATTIQGAVVNSISDTLSANPTGQLFVEPLVNVLNLAHDMVGKSCTGCVFGGQTLSYPAGSHLADFSGWNFTGADFSHAVLTNLDLSEANLSNTKFIGATLTDVVLNNATLSTAGIDFTGATLTGVTFTGDDVSNFVFNGATLNQIQFSKAGGVSGGNLQFGNATLNQVDLSGITGVTTLPFAGATLCGTSIQGTDQYHIVDLTSGNFAGAHVVLSSSCAANLSYTQLAAAPAVGSQWAGLNLTGTIVTGLENKVLSSQTNPLSLVGATITGASLQGGIFDYAVGLANQTLSNVTFNKASLRFVDLHNSRLYGAQFVNSNLEGANMNAVYLTPSAAGNASLAGAFLRDVNLSQAQLGGADFTNANFYGEAPAASAACTPDPNTGFTSGCATAAHAIMDGTAFNGAYLYGTDFSYSTAVGANFGNAFLTGANFASANITASAGVGTGFSGAFLQGTNMSGIALGARVSLENAFVDFRPKGNILFLSLSGEHTTFAGYWGTPGEPVCTQMVYSYPTAVPTTNRQNTCPNGGQYLNGCGPASADGSNGNWESAIDISTQASYWKKATYTNAPATPICSYDPLWSPAPGSRPARPHPPRPLPPRPIQPRPVAPVQP